MFVVSWPCSQFILNSMRNLLPFNKSASCSDIVNWNDDWRSQWGWNGDYDELSIYIFILPVACDVTNSSVVSDFDSDFALTMK